MPVKVSEEDVQGFLEKAIELARASGELMREAFYKDKKVDTKTNHADLVTETDGAIERDVIAALKEAYPDHRFIGEETAVDGKQCDFTDDPTWILDPIDGTTNFIHGIPDFAFSLGVTVNKEPVVGVIYLPIPDTMYTARKGKGAYCNGKKITANVIHEVSQALVMSEGGNGRDETVIRTHSDNLHQILTRSRGLRAYGSTAIDLCKIACGQGEAYVQYDLHCWDMAAGVVLVREAGATVMDPTGSGLDLMSRRVLVATSEDLARQISAMLSHIANGRD
ncbi:inositol monophosphatase 2-like isoform X1 [Haliotis cracherodii]|uniref:inositol monophosphatase 2-like isoform X1 n=1 Tax=Haliotis cracherodii TaxID=6455 RepID=UPI0039E73FD4